MTTSVRIFSTHRLAAW